MSRHSETSLPGPTQEGLSSLVAQLARHGAIVPDADRFELLTVACAWLEEPARPPRLLDLDESEAQDYLRERALLHLLAERVRQEESRLFLSALREELAAAIRTDADVYVSVLNASFMPLLAQVAALRGRGVTESDTAETMIERDPETIAAWRHHRAEVAPALDALAELRFDLSRVALVAPVSSTRAEVGPRLWSACFTPAIVYDQPGESAAGRWLRIAATPDVRLSLPGEFSELDALALEAPALNVGMLHAIAAARAKPTTD